MHSRTQWLIGDEGLAKLKRASVAVFGLGGVGGTCTEALARSGVGRLLLVDGDAVHPSNCNRQIMATTQSLGRRKVDAMAERVAAVNPDVRVETADVFYLPETAGSVSLVGLDCIVDAVDTVTAKLLLIESAVRQGIDIISCMGTGNKLDPTQVELADLADTSVCPLARVMRRELKARGILHVPVVYSREQPIAVDAPCENGRHLCGSMMFVPSAAGLACASYVVRRLLS